MNDQLQSKLAEVIGAILNGVRTAGDFAMQQLPEIAQQYVLYGRAYLTFVFAALVAAAGVCAFIALRYGFFGRQPDQCGMWADSRLIACVVGGIGAGLFGGVALLTSSSLFLVWFAPKVWLLKELAGFMK